jgi:hypothetical protein
LERRVGDPSSSLLRVVAESSKRLGEKEGPLLGDEEGGLFGIMLGSELDEEVGSTVVLRVGMIEHSC